MVMELRRAEIRHKCVLEFVWFLDPDDGNIISGVKYIFILVGLWG